MYLKSRHCWSWESLNYIKLEGRDMKREVKKEPEPVREQAMMSTDRAWMWAKRESQEKTVARPSQLWERKSSSRPWHLSLLLWVLSLSHTPVLFLLLRSPVSSLRMVWDARWQHFSGRNQLQVTIMKIPNQNFTWLCPWAVRWQPERKMEVTGQMQKLRGNPY